MAKGLLASLLCLGNSNDPPSRPTSPEQSLPSPHQQQPSREPSPPHKLPAFDFPASLDAPEPPSQPQSQQQPLPTPPPTVVLPPAPPALQPPQLQVPPPTKLGQLSRLEAPALTHSVTPPTPIEPPQNGVSTSSSLAQPSIPRSASPPSTSSSPSHSRAPSLLTSSPLLFPPPSPNLTVSNNHPSSSSSQPDGPRRGHHHRRSSSTHSGTRSFRETLNAYASEGENGQRSVNQYILGETLGRGSYATVERAVDRETGFEYAIKEFSKRRLRQIASAEAQRRERLAARASGGGRGRGRGRGRGGMLGATGRLAVEEQEVDSGPDNLDLVRTEVAIMKKVDHPNLASVHEVIDVTSDDALLIMELCEGGPIFKLRDGDQVTPYPEDEARKIFRQLVLGTAYLHHNQIIHRDIKPDNALFADTSRTHVKLVDFGVSKFAASQHPAGLKAEPTNMSVAGSPAYMSPELMSGPQDREVAAEEEEKTGYACDVWSLGVTLYALVVGCLPFKASDPTELFRAIREAEPEYPPTLSPELLHLLRSLLSKSPAQRPSIPSLWTDSWLTASGTFPLPPYEDNVATVIAEPSGEEVDRALAVYRGSTFLALSAAAKFKGLLTNAARRRASQASLNSSPTSSPALTPSAIVVDSPEMVASPTTSPHLAATSAPSNANSNPFASAAAVLHHVNGERDGSPTPVPPTPTRGRSPGRPAPPRQQLVQQQQRKATRMDTMSSLALSAAASTDGGSSSQPASRWASRDDEYDEPEEMDEGEADRTDEVVTESPVEKMAEEIDFVRLDGKLKEEEDKGGDGKEAQRWEDPE